MKICPVCESTLFDDMDTCFGCLYRFGSDPALEAARSAKAVPWSVAGGWRLRVRSEGLQPRGSSLTVEIEPV